MDFLSGVNESHVRAERTPSSELAALDVLPVLLDWRMLAIRSKHRGKTAMMDCQNR